MYGRNGRWSAVRVGEGGSGVDGERDAVPGWVWVWVWVFESSMVGGGAVGLRWRGVAGQSGGWSLGFFSFFIFVKKFKIK